MKIYNNSLFRVALKTLLYALLLICAFFIGLGLGVLFLSQDKKQADSNPIVMIDFAAERQAIHKPSLLERTLKGENLEENNSSISSTLNYDTNN